jgi:chemotaxis protein CheD
VLEPMRGRSHHLGLQNVDIAMRLLAERSIPILAQDVGGERGRKLIFHTDTGGSWIRLL